MTILTINISNIDNTFYWDMQRGIGYMPSNGFDYDQEYFDAYENLAATPMSDKLMESRRAFVHRVMGNVSLRELCDVGVGSGAFVEWVDCNGTDINPASIQWLKDNNRYVEFGKEPVEAATFWDSLEHIDELSEYLNYVQRYVFISCPIYYSIENALLSKHFKPNEHIWYWTQEGLEHMMAEHGFGKIVGRDNFEIRCGRENIVSYAFMRTNDSIKPTIRPNQRV